MIQEEGAGNVKRERKLELTNREGKKLFLELGTYRKGDEEGMLSCVRDEYGNTYVKKELSGVRDIEEASREGHILFLTARTLQGEIAGIMALKEDTHHEYRCEFASQVFRKKYRGYGLAMEMFRYGMELMQERRIRTAYCEPVLFHTITQRLLYRLGFRATGLLLQLYDLDRLTHSYGRGRSKKMSLGIQVKSLLPGKLHVIFVPAEHRDFCRQVYASLGVSCLIEEGRELPDISLPDKSVLMQEYDKENRYLEITILSSGKDLSERINRCLGKYPLEGKQTAGIFLNGCDSYAPWAYCCLRSRGFFFAGLKPLCGEREYLILHHPGELPVRFEEFKVSGEFAALCDYIEGCYRQRQTFAEADRGRCATAGHVTKEI